MEQDRDNNFGGKLISFGTVYTLLLILDALMSAKCLMIWQKQVNMSY